MNSVVAAIVRRPEYAEYQRLAASLGVELELESRVGKLLCRKNRYLGAALTESIVQMSTTSLGAGELGRALSQLKAGALPALPPAEYSRVSAAQDLQFEPDIPAPFVACLQDAVAMRSYDFVQKSASAGAFTFRQRETTAGELLERVCKVRLANFDVATRFDFDYRVSVALEVPCPAFKFTEQQLRRRYFTLFEGAECDVTESEQGWQVEVERKTCHAGRVVARAREICALLSDYCAPYQRGGGRGEGAPDEGSEFS